MREPINPETADQCAICKKNPKEDIHHIDGDSDNDAEKNQLPVCKRCNNRIHKGFSPQYLIWFHLLDPDTRHTSLPKVGRETEPKRDKRARNLDTRLRQAFDAACDAFTDTAASGEQGDVYLSLNYSISQEATFLNRFTHIAITKKWSESRYEHRARPIVLTRAGDKGTTLRLSSIDTHPESGSSRDKAKKQAAYETFQSEMNTAQGLSVGTLTVEQDADDTDDWTRIA